MAHSGEMVMAIRGGREAFDVEAEPVTIVRQGVRTLFILDDGERLEFETGELLAAILVSTFGDRASAMAKRMFDEGEQRGGAA